MLLRRFRRVVSAVCVLLCLPAAALTWWASGSEDAGATVITAANFGTYNGVTSYGECNELLLAPGYNYQNGFAVQVACQGMVGAGAVPAALEPALPVSSLQEFNASTGHWASNAVSGSAEWMGDFAVGDDEVSGSLAHGDECDPQVSGTHGADDHWYEFLNQSSPASGEPVWCTGSVSNMTDAAGVCPDNSSDGGDCADWLDRSTVMSVELGASETVSGHAYQSFQMVEEWTFNADPVGQPNTGVGGNTPVGLTHPAVTPAVSLLSGSSCGTVSLGTSGSNITVGGTTVSGAAGVRLALGQDSGDAGAPSYMSSPYTTYGMALSSLKCSDAPFYVDKVALPGDYFTGGQATQTTYNGVALPCTLNSVVNPPVSETAGDSYAATFDYSGAADNLAVDPGDELPGTTVSIGGNPAVLAVDGQPLGSTPLGDDSTVVSATGSPQAVAFTPAKITGDYEGIMYYCAYQGVVYDWGAADGGEGGSGGGVSSPVCTSNPQNPGECTDQTTPPGIDACFASAGWDLYNPVTWVTGALSDGLCIVKALFEPTASTLSSFVNLFRVTSAGTSSATAGQWIGALTTFATGFPTASVTAIQSAADSGSCSLGPSVSLAPGHAFSACSALSAAGGATSWTLIDSIVSAGFLVLVGLAMFHVIRKTVAGGGAA